MTDFNRIKQFYDGFNEWDRRNTTTGEFEFNRTMHYIRKYIKPRSTVLDLGGGPGRYTIELAKDGHTVYLADLSPSLIEYAKTKVKEYGVESSVPSINIINATDLSIYDDSIFDIVLALGPFYHLTAEDERQKAVLEINRVLKNNGIVIASFIPRLSGLAGLINMASINIQRMSINNISETYRTGVFKNEIDRGFQEGYYPYPNEIKSLFESTGLTCIEMASLRGIACDKTELMLKIKDCNEEIYKTFMEILDATANDESMVSCGSHALYIGKKK